ncbi:hypothetical protein EJN92_08750 [Undibacterium parvum]|nr:hypothetical protein EJN92_08750 [Undibacterium parvum]
MMSVLAVIITLIYPLAIWFGHGQVQPRWLALLLLLAVATRLPTLAISRVARWSVLAGMLLVLLAVWNNALLPLKLYPVLVNAGLLAAFGYSLLAPPSMVERLARMREPDLPAVAVGYTRRVTQVWCGFFILNGALAFATALWASEALWSLYTGVISYLLMGALFGIEFLLRLRFKRLHHV